MAGLPVTIRLLDPPLHEFLPHKEEEIERGRRDSRGVPIETLKRAGGGTARVQPDAGPSRRAGSASPIPEIYEMQARAIFEAALDVAEETGKAAGAGDHDPAGRHPEPSSSSCARVVVQTAERVFNERNGAGRHIWSAR